MVSRRPPTGQPTRTAEVSRPSAKPISEAVWRRIIRDKTFFFMDYQGWRVRQAQAYLSTVPTAAMKSGDFSALTRVIYDPGNPGVPFSGNRIPSAQFDKAGKNILDQLYPAPNVPGTISANGHNH